MLEFGAKLAHELVHAMEKKGTIGRGEGSAYLRQNQYERANGLKPTHSNTEEILSHIGRSYSARDFGEAVKEIYQTLKPAGEALVKFVQDVYSGAPSDSVFAKSMRQTFGSGNQSILQVTRQALRSMTSEYHLENNILAEMRNQHD